jgi:dTDP-4-amino-4,6-dideoxygalactose transaminase
LLRGEVDIDPDTLNMSRCGIEAAWGMRTQLVLLFRAWWSPEINAATEEIAELPA